MSLSNVFSFFCLIAVMYCIYHDVRIYFSIKDSKNKLLWLALIACWTVVIIYLFFRIMTPPFIWEVMKNEGARFQGLGAYVFSNETTIIFYTKIALFPLNLFIFNRDKEMSLRRVRFLAFQIILSLVFPV